MAPPLLSLLEGATTMTERHLEKSATPVAELPVPQPVVRLVSRPSVTIIDGRLVAVKELTERVVH